MEMCEPSACHACCWALDLLWVIGTRGCGAGVCKPDIHKPWVRPSPWPPFQGGYLSAAVPQSSVSVVKTTQRRERLSGGRAGFLDSFAGSARHREPPTVEHVEGAGAETRLPHVS